MNFPIPIAEVLSTWHRKWLIGNYLTIKDRGTAFQWIITAWEHFSTNSSLAALPFIRMTSNKSQTQ